MESRRTKRLAAGLVLIFSTLSPIKTVTAAPWWLTRYPVSETATSVVFSEEDAQIFASPGATERRGATKKGWHVPLFGAAPSNATCSKRWFYIGPQAWVCENVASFDSRAISRAIGKSTPEGPRYYQVTADGAFGYSTMRLAEEEIPDTQLEPGFSVAVVGTDSTQAGTQLARTSHDFLIPFDTLKSVQPSKFKGYHFGDKPTSSDRFGWVRSDVAPVFSANHRRVPGKSLARQTFVHLKGRGNPKDRARETWVTTLAGELLRRKDVAIPTLRKIPTSLARDERWLHVDLKEQLLVAYEGERAVFATLVSTGVGVGASKAGTPKGLHRIWVKLESTDMTNLEDANAGSYYAIESVPHVQFFKDGYGLHGAFWHNSFGRRRSHGCVNLSLSDAEFLFAWTRPRLPEGWRAVHPTNYELGTAILVE